jgi:T5orf172 domain
MKPGYIYILTNESMPGVVKVGRTERQPETRSKELHTTGVPQPFKLEYFVFVDDCQTAEQQIHSLLEGKGLRTSSNREFFNAHLHDVIQAVELVTHATSNPEPNFNNRSDLALLAATLPIPVGNALLDRDYAEKLAERLAQIARKGYPPSMQRCAEIFEVNSPSSYLFKYYWKEFLALARAEAMHLHVASGGKALRHAVGKDAAEYIARCNARGWLQEEDFIFISEFLVDGDQFQYEGYIQQIRRYNFPTSVMNRAEAV